MNKMSDRKNLHSERICFEVEVSFSITGRLCWAVGVRRLSGSVPMNDGLTLILESQQYGDKWKAVEGDILGVGAWSYEKDMRQKDRHLFMFYPIAGLRKIQEGEVFCQVETEETVGEELQRSTME